MYPIRTIDGVETPAPGPWTIPNQRFAAPSEAGDHVVRGLLVVGDEVADTWLSLTIVAPDATTIIKSRLVAANDVGHWRFVGTACADGAERAVTVEARYHGVFRRNGRTSTWLTIDVAPDSRTWFGRRQRHILKVDLNADVPPAISTQAA